MRSEAELDRADYHLRLMIERMQRAGSSEAAIAKAIRIATGCKPRGKMPGHGAIRPGDPRSPAPLPRQ